MASGNNGSTDTKGASSPKEPRSPKSSKSERNQKTQAGSTIAPKSSKASSRRRRRARFERYLGIDHLWSVLAGLCLIALLTTHLGSRGFNYAVGDIVTDDIVAPAELRVEDPEATQRRRDEAVANVDNIYDFDPFAWRASLGSLNTLFAWGRERLATVAQGNAAVPWSELDEETRGELGETGTSVAGLMLPEEFLPRLWDEGFTAETELAAEAVLRSLFRRTLIGTTEVLSLGGSRTMTLRDIDTQEETRVDDLSAFLDLESARARIRRAVIETTKIPQPARDSVVDHLAALLRPNVTYNSNETQERRFDAIAGVDQVFYLLKRGRTILRAGDPVTERSLPELRAIEEQWSDGGTQTRVAGVALLVALVVMSLWRFVQHHRRRWRFHKVRRLYQLILLVLVGSVLLFRLMLFVGTAVSNAFAAPPLSVAEVYPFAIPFAMGALLVMLLSDSYVAWVYAALQTVLVGVMTGDVGVAAFSMLSSFAAVYAMSRFAQRTEMLHTGVTIGAVNVVAVLALGLYADPVPPWTELLFQMSLAMFGGIQVALLASALLPALEQLFNTLTDVKLLELSNMNLPLLKQLSMTAPGTYQHSIVIGNLVEKAAEAIGANPLFARVAAYYHDIGKMRQPQYFVENQKAGRNLHDKLSPHMSALILVRHVKDGIDYAEEERLPQPLIDAIPQHHGTRLMKYFYERAKTQADPETGEVKEDEFRYPGPKPQTKETALVMLADGVEAMSRLIDDPTPRRLRNMIMKNIRDVLDDGQLDECDITLGDLAQIREAFQQVLSAMHHHRIEYPEDAKIVPAEPQPEGAAI